MADLIDREVLLKKLSSLDTGWNESWSRAVNECGMVVDAMPTIDAEPVRHGRWENVPGFKSLFYCSGCRKPKPQGYVRYAFCPHCGCKMDLEGERYEFN